MSHVGWGLRWAKCADMQPLHCTAQSPAPDPRVTWKYCSWNTSTKCCCVVFGSNLQDETLADAINVFSRRVEYHEVGTEVSSDAKSVVGSLTATYNRIPWQKLVQPLKALANLQLDLFRRFLVVGPQCFHVKTFTKFTKSKWVMMKRCRAIYRRVEEAFHLIYLVTMDWLRYVGLKFDCRSHKRTGPLRISRRRRWRQSHGFRHQVHRRHCRLHTCN